MSQLHWRALVTGWAHCWVWRGALMSPVNRQAFWDNRSIKWPSWAAVNGDIVDGVNEWLPVHVPNYIVVFWTQFLLSLYKENHWLTYHNHLCFSFFISLCCWPTRNFFFSTWIIVVHLKMQLCCQWCNAELKISVKSQEIATLMNTDHFTTCTFWETGKYIHKEITFSNNFKFHCHMDAILHMSSVFSFNYWL